MFELTTPTAALLKSVTPRQEHHGEDIVVALSMRLEITGSNTLLDLLSPKLRHALYTAVEAQEPLPGVEVSTPLLRFDAFDHHAIKATFEGWTLRVDHGVDEDDPIALGGCKVDTFRLEAMQGGTIKLAFRIGTNDISSEEIGLLCGKLGSEISITLHAPEKPVDAIDASSSATDLPPSAEDLFSAGADDDGPEDEDDEDDDGSSTDADADAEPQDLEDRLDQSLGQKGDNGPFPRPAAAADEIARIEGDRANINSKRTARGRAQTKAALAAGMAAAEAAS